MHSSKFYIQSNYFVSHVKCTLILRWLTIPFYENIHILKFACVCVPLLLLLFSLYFIHFMCVRVYNLVKIVMCFCAKNHVMYKTNKWPNERETAKIFCGLFSHVNFFYDKYVDSFVMFLLHFYYY